MEKDLTKLQLEELHIYKQNAYQKLADLGRLLPGLPKTAYEHKDYLRVGSVYKRLEEEMNDRIMKAVEKDKNHEQS